ncbi:MAG: hypothetical protein M3Y22_04210 [Pseudomonadota bacterium]|nr:hypothetical protein [Pseudomonadota bacterium]
MKQPHTETSIEHTDDQQNTGNHKRPGAGDADKLAGTRAGAENVEAPAKAHSVPNKLARDGHSADGAEQAPERDERGRL